MKVEETRSFPTYESFQVWFDERTEAHPFKTGKGRGPFHDDWVSLECLREDAK